MCQRGSSSSVLTCRLEWLGYALRLASLQRLTGTSVVLQFALLLPRTVRQFFAGESHSGAYGLRQIKENNLTHSEAHGAY